MKISSTHVGTLLSAYRTVIDWRRTTNYAAAVGDHNPCYFDDTRPEGLMAHPVFPVAVTWPITLHMDRYLQGTTFPVELMAMQVHHTEHIVLHRPICPEQALTVAGTVAAILPHRAGTRVVIRYEAADDDGRPVFTEHIGGMLRGVACTDDGHSLPGLPPDPPPVPDSAPLWRRPLAIDPMLPYIYDGCSDIVFPIHTSPAFAMAVGLPGIILQGTCTLALAVRELVAAEVHGRPEWVTDFSCRFAGMVFPGSTVTVRLLQRMTEEDRTILCFDVTDETGRPALRSGRLGFRLFPAGQNKKERS
ncbi:MAG: MaoC family dehydratase N-terminal domain-containing protein [Desulfobacterales bacterium]|nr:MaoC family dehydratase N-terminal domain-containing protein [Desulfobacterales bacterium]